MKTLTWVELPDWENKAAYEFLYGTSAAIWAWEFLRRCDEYRKDWLMVCKQEKAGKLSIIRTPAMNDAESVESWMARVVGAGGIPKSTRIDVHFAEKWGMRDLYDPFLPYSEEIAFIPPRSDFPRMILTPEEFFDVVGNEATADGDEFQKVAEGHAVLVFDLTQPVNGQGKKTETILRRWRKKMLAAKRIVKADNTSNSPGNWLCYLRVLDALRATPKATYAKIGKVLGGVDEEQISPPHKTGERLINAARAISEKGYRDALLYAGIPLPIST